jgi:hypothetical protein
VEAAVAVVEDVAAVDLVEAAVDSVTDLAEAAVDLVAVVAGFGS